jgi:hypothetical protein
MIKTYTYSSAPKSLRANRLKSFFRVLYIIALLLLSLRGFGQATLPFSHGGPWKGLTTLPGYSETGLGTDYSYSLPSGTGTSARFSKVGDNIVLSFTTVPGNLSFYLKAVAGSAAYSSSFRVYQAVTAGNYTLLGEVVNQSKDVATLVTLNPDAATRFIKLELHARANCNIALDEILLTQATPEINVRQSANIASGGTYAFGDIASGASSGAKTFTIENTGKATLNLSGLPIVAISGANAADFSINQSATGSSVMAGGSTTFTVSFNPSSVGPKTAAITILNNDSDEGTYTINLTGNGTAVSLGPTITSFTPVEGPEGTYVMISGTNLVDVESVTFNGVESMNFFDYNDTELEAEVPVGATSGFIVVTTAEGTATSASIFTVTGVPTILEINPNIGKAGDYVLITGTRFNEVTSVSFNGTESLNFFEYSDTELEAEVPEGATTGYVTVTTSEGTATSPEEFTVIVPTITVTGPVTSFSAAPGTTSTSQSYTLSGTDIADNIIIAAPDQFEVSLSAESGFGASVSVAAVDGVVASTTLYMRYAPTASGEHTGDITHASTGAQTQLLAVSGSTNAPMITITGTFNPSINQVINTPTAGQQFTVSGTNLLGDITITAPANYEVSVTSVDTGFGATVDFAQSGGTVAPTTFWIRYNPTTLLGHPAQVVASTSGASDVHVVVNGHAVAIEPTESSYIMASNPTTGSIDLTLVGLGDGQKRIILARHASTLISGDPVDGTTYSASATFGSGSQIGQGNYVVYIGTGTEVTVTGLGGGATYVFTVYDFNDDGLAGAENYFSEGNIASETTLPATYVWNVASGNWDQAASWSPLRSAPSTTDILIFDGAVQANPIVTIDFNATRTIGQLKFVNSSNARFNVEADATLNLQTEADQAGHDFIVEAGSALTVFTNSNTRKLILGIKTGKTGLVGGAITLEGTAQASHRIRPESAGALVFESGSVFTAGPFFAGNPFGTLNSVIFRSGSTYVHSSAADANPFGALAPNSVLTFESNSTYRHESTGNMTLSGRTYGHLVLNHPDFNRSNIIGTGGLNVENLTITAGTAMGVNLTGTVNIKGDITVNAGALTFDPASANTINLNAEGVQTISGTGGLTFGSNAAVALAATAEVYLLKNMVVNGSLNVGNALHMDDNVISGAGLFSMSNNATLGIGHAGGISGSGATGNIQTAGFRNYSSSGTYIYNGTVAQITGNGLPDVVNVLTINNPAGVTSTVISNVQGALNLTQGLFTTSASNSLTIMQSGTINGGGATNFVNGPLAQIVANTSATRVFPIGKGSSYLPVTLDLSHADGQPNIYTAEQINAAPNARTLTGDIKRISASRHFRITKLGGSVINEAFVTLNYNNDINEPDAAALRIAKSSGSNWVSIGGTGSAPGTGAGMITSDSFTSFSDFVVSSINLEPAPLPVTLMSFTAALANGQVNLDWVTASELNNDRFEVERSGNGLDFTLINTVKGAGTTNEKRRYQDVDRKPLSGTSYYRLKQVDFDGTVAYSRTVAVNNNSSRKAEAKIFPNPAADFLQLDLGTPGTNVKVMVVNMVGQVVISQQLSGFESQQHFNLDVSRLAKGPYQLLIHSNELKTTKKFLKTDR